MTEKRRGLGRGLGALIPSTSEDSETAAAARPGRPVDLFFPAGGSGTGGVGRGAINKDALLGPAPTRRAGGRKASDKSPVRDESGKTSKAEPTAVADTGVVDSPEAPTSGGQPPRRKSGPSAGTTGGRAKSTGIKGAASSADEATAKKPAATRSGRGAKKAKDKAENAAPNAGAPEAPSVNESGDSAQPVVEQDATSTDAAQSAAVSRETLVPVPGATFAELPLDSIHPNRKQPRTVFDEDAMAELVHSIREIGVLQPIVVRPSTDDENDAPYELVMGERRWRASREAGMESVPAIIRSTQDVDLLRDALLENLHRSQLNPLEEAAAYQQLLDDFECSHEELAERIGRSRPQITNTLRLMKLPPLVQRRLAAGVLTAGHARALLGLGDAADMEKLAQRIVAEGLSVRATEELVSLSDGAKRPTRQQKPKENARHERLDYLANALSDRLDTSVKITLGAKKGKVSIEFASVDDLNRIMSVLNQPAG